MLELANVISVDKLQEIFAERMRQIEEGKQHVAKLEQEINAAKSNLIAIDGAAQQLRLLIQMCEESAAQNVPDGPTNEAPKPAEVDWSLDDEDDAA